jgi:hypothetical protein
MEAGAPRVHAEKGKGMKAERKERQRRAASGGQTLLELVGASTIIAIALVPALRVMRDTVRVGRETEMANLMATFCTSKLEESLADTLATWDDTTLTGTFTTEGYAGVRFQVNRSDAMSDGGIPDGLMSITSTVWEDRDSDGSWDADELRSVFATKLARSLAYEVEAGGS